MRSTALVFRFLTVWGLIAPAAFGADPVKEGGNPEPFAGMYYFGDGKGWKCSLTLSAGNQFSYTRDGCCGVISESQGKFEVKNNTVIFNPDKTPMWLGLPSKPEVWHLVRWGDRKYLIAQSQLIDFCMDMNHGVEPRKYKNFGAHYYLRMGDWDKPVTGRPQLPKEFEKQFGPNPMEGKIVEMSGKNEAWVDFGAEAAIEVGKTLYVQGTPGMCFSRVRIVEVKASRCRIKPDGQTDLVKVGNSVSSWRPYSFLP